EAFAAYAESAPVTLVAAAWWWVALQRPLNGRRAGTIAATSWLCLCLAHRVGLIMLIPQTIRALIPRQDDTSSGRQWMFIGTLLGLGCALGLTFAINSGGTLVQDARELLGSLRHSSSWVPLPDIVCLTLLVTPLAALSPAFAGGTDFSWWRGPEGVVTIAAVVPLLPMLVLFPTAAHGLGAHRDWDLAALPGFIGEVSVASWLATTAARSFSRVTRLLIPVLLL